MIAKIWKDRIEARTQSFDSCPIQYKEEVLSLMRDDVKNKRTTPNGEKMTSKLFKELTGTKY